MTIDVIGSNKNYREVFEEVERKLPYATTVEELKPFAEASLEVEEQIQQISKQFSFWTWLVECFCGLVGLMTEFQKLKLEASNFEAKLVEQTERLSLNAVQLEEMRGRIDRIQDQISKGAEELLLELDQVDKTIAYLEEQLKSPLNRSEEEFRKIISDASDLACFVKRIATSINVATTISSEESDNSNAIELLITRYGAIVQKSKVIQSTIASKWTKDSIQKLDAVGGISNAGNTCYLASALQAINVVPSYKRAFNLNENPLQKREGEEEESFEQRQKIQEMGSGVLCEISRGRTVGGSQISALRAACFKCNIVDNENGTVDAVETLEKLLDAMDYKPGSFSITTSKRLESDSHEVIELPKNKKFEDYSTIKEITTIAFSTIEVTAQNTSMQALIDVYWADEMVEGVTIKDVNEAGEPILKLFGQVIVSKTPSVEIPPEVLKVTVTQLGTEKATITAPEFVYPFGLNGPQYQLMAAIEHQPGHYVTHIFKNGHVRKANDSIVSDSQPDLGGLSYFYIPVVQS